MATLENHASVAATLKLVREERSRLYRFLRKLSFLEPLPSWAPFITARVTIVSRQTSSMGSRSEAFASTPRRSPDWSTTSASASAPGRPWIACERRSWSLGPSLIG